MLDRLPDVRDVRRDWIEQPRCFLGEHLNGHWDLRTERRISRTFDLPRLPRQSRDQVWGISMVRDEADIIELSVDHLLHQGADHLLIADNLSQDGTTQKLLDLARNDPRIHVAQDREPGYFQKEKMSYLARAAWRCGARWVVPFDADEFWFAPRVSLARYLRRTEATVFSAHMVDLLPTGDQLSTTTEFMMESGRGGPRKVAFRSHPLALLAPGNHGVARVGADQPGLVVAHVPYRSPTQMRRKFRTGASAIKMTGGSWAGGWHWQAGDGLSDDQVARMWEAMGQGAALDEIGWRGVDAGASARVLEWACWPLDPPD